MVAPITSTKAFNSLLLPLPPPPMPPRNPLAAPPRLDRHPDLRVIGRLGKHAQRLDRLPVFADHTRHVLARHACIKAEVSPSHDRGHVDLIGVGDDCA